MSEWEQNKALLRRWFQEVWNDHRVEAIDELLTEDVIAYGLTSTGRDYIGRDDYKEHHRLFLDAFPDMTITVQEMVAEGDMVSVRFICRGTYPGDTLGIAPTG